jgi:hypothetical protein
MNTKHAEREFAFDHVRTRAVCAARTAELERLQAEFLRAGNQITVLPGYVPKPLPLPSYIGTGSRAAKAGRRAERELDQRAAPIVHRYRWHGMKAIRERLHEAGIGMQPRRVELIAARHGILIAEGAA